MVDTDRELPSVLGTKFVVARDSPFNWRRLFRQGGDQNNLFPSDQGNIQEYFRRFHKTEVQCIATDKFLNKSKDEYSAPWLTREIVQNFVDHNKDHPGILDGVRFAEEKGKAGTKFIIEGNWEFTDPTGLTALHSDKPTDFETAGGNGIGIKQTAIRFLRDFGVETFIVQGNGWDVEYQLARAQDIIADWQRRDPARWRDKSPLIQHDWLIAKIKPAQGRKDKCAYIIETDNSQVIAALRQFPSLGVSKDNPFLRDCDYISEQHGAIKWLASTQDRGRLFINGQVMQYQERGTADNFWTGTEGVSIDLKNIKYRVNIDRPPVSGSDLWTYLNDIVSGMTKNELISQLKASEHLWTQIGSADHYAAFSRIIDRALYELSWKGYKKDEYANFFGDKKYLYMDRDVSKNQISELETQGYIVLPSNFENLGMSSASSKLSNFEQATNVKPASRTEIGREWFKASEEKGILVEYQDLQQIREIKSATDFFNLLKDRFSPVMSSFGELPGKPNTFRINFNTTIDKELLAKILSKPKNDAERLLYFIRGAIYHGINNQVFQRAFTSQGEYITTYDPNPIFEDMLIRNTKCPTDLGTFLEFELDARNGEILRNILSGKTEGVASNGSVEQQTPSTPTTPKEVEKGITGKVDLLQKFNTIPVEQSSPPEVSLPHRVIKKEVGDLQQVKDLEKMERQLPALRQAVELLDSVVSPETTDSVKENDPVKKYVDWRTSGKFYEVAQTEAGYLSGRHLLEIIAENYQADIATVDVNRPESEIAGEYQALNERLQSIANRNRDKGEIVDDFEIVLEPTITQLAQLGLLRSFIQITTGVVLPNDLFVYKGTGSKGINIGKKAIGIHEALLKVVFNEAEGTFTHETAHNWELDHNAGFIAALQSLNSSAKRKMLEVIEKQSKGQRLGDDEAVIVDIQNTWNTLSGRA